MKTGIINFKSAKLVILLALMAFLLCKTESPTESDNMSVEISLVNEGTKEADYFGDDIDLIIEFSDSIVVNLGTTFNIHNLNAQIVHTKEMVNNEKVKLLTVPLYWESTAILPFDSSIKKTYDTIFVQSDISQSNVVKVNIYNLPPRVTDFTVGDSTYNVPSHITDIVDYDYTVSDSSDSASDSVIAMSLTIIDPDNTYIISWGIFSNDIVPEIEKCLIYSSTTAKYYIRNGNIDDIVSIIINDGDKQIHFRVNLTRFY